MLSVINTSKTHLERLYIFFCIFLSGLDQADIVYMHAFPTFFEALVRHSALARFTLSLSYKKYNSGPSLTLWDQSLNPNPTPQFGRAALTFASKWWFVISN